MYIHQNFRDKNIICAWYVLCIYLFLFSYGIKLLPIYVLLSTLMYFDMFADIDSFARTGSLSTDRAWLNRSLRLYFSCVCVLGWWIWHLLSEEKGQPVGTFSGIVSELSNGQACVMQGIKIRRQWRREREGGRVSRSGSLAVSSWVLS